MVLCKENNKFIDACDEEPSIAMIFLKNKNPHDAKTATYGDIQKFKPVNKAIIK